MVANRERRLSMTNHNLLDNRKRTRNALLRHAIAICLALLAWCPPGRAQAGNPAAASAEDVKQLREVVQSLLIRVAELETQLKQRRSASTDGVQRTPVDPASSPAAVVAAAPVPAAPAQIDSPAEQKEHLIAGDRGILDYLHGATLNFTLDEYYAYNFNRPVGRVNALRAYDVLSNNISLNQADLVFERTPDTARPFGVRIDFQFGQATDTLQGNPLNEPRPQLYRNIFQAYGTYVAPLGKGLTLDAGKWGSSIGIEGTTPKTRSTIPEPTGSISCRPIPWACAPAPNSMIG